MSTGSLWDCFTGASLVRRAADATLVRYARRRVRRLDRANPAAIQENLLLGLVRQARHTRFGREHEFEHIRSVAEYQQSVPLRTYEEFWREYWKDSFPRLENATWPGSMPYLALSSGTTSGTTKYLPISREMLASNRRAALTTLAFFRAAHPEASLFTGRIFFLGGSTDLQSLGDGVLGGDLSGIAAREVAGALRPYTFPPLDIGLLKDWEQKVQILAERSAALPITAVSGVPSWLLVLFDRLRQVTGKKLISEIWPHLKLVVHGGTKFDPYRSLFQEVIGSDQVHFVETYPASEGFIATEDPRHRLLRLVPDHRLFFEFVPLDELAAARPTRHTLANLVPGVQYAVIMTTCAGLWSYVIGDTVSFEQRDPPLLRFTGRTHYFLSAFGEHVISEEVERAVTAAAEATRATVVDFHVGPIFPDSTGGVGRHRYLIEFAQPPATLDSFAAVLDRTLCQLNEDYLAHRQGDLTMLAPEVVEVPRCAFHAWLRERGQLGGQHKVPRMDPSGQLTAELSQWVELAKRTL